MQAVSLAIKPGQLLHQNFETILQKVPTELWERINRRHLPDDTPSDPPSEKALIRLHKQVIGVENYFRFLLLIYIFSGRL